jgi:peptidoglycan hydrolase-like protein with peptidoglycan-binding domain
MKSFMHLGIMLIILITCTTIALADPPITQTTTSEETGSQEDTNPQTAEDFLGSLDSQTPETFESLDKAEQEKIMKSNKLDFTSEKHQQMGYSYFSTSEAINGIASVFGDFLKGLGVPLSSITGQSPIKSFDGSVLSGSKGGATVNIDDFKDNLKLSVKYSIEVKDGKIIVTDKENSKNSPKIVGGTLQFTDRGVASTKGPLIMDYNGYSLKIGTEQGGKIKYKSDGYFQITSSYFNGVHFKSPTTFRYHPDTNTADFVGVEITQIDASYETQSGTTATSLNIGGRGIQVDLTSDKLEGQLHVKSGSEAEINGYTITPKEKDTTINLFFNTEGDSSSNSVSFFDPQRFTKKVIRNKETVSEGRVLEIKGSGFIVTASEKMKGSTGVAQIQFPSGTGEESKFIEIPDGEEGSYSISTRTPSNPKEKEAIEELQRQLKAAGLYTKGIDGDYGPSTTAAIKELQTKKEIEVTGIFDSETRAALTSYIKEKGLTSEEIYLPASQGFTSTTRTPSDPAQKAAIEELQRQLKSKGLYTGKIDGDYGPGTAAAVARAQDEIGGSLQATAKKGVFDAQTRDAWYEHINKQSEFDSYSVDNKDAIKSDPLLKEQLMQIQTLLKGKYYSGPIDGDYGGGTKTAVEELQEDLDLPITGVFDAETKRRWLEKQEPVVWDKTFIYSPNGGSVSITQTEKGKKHATLSEEASFSVTKEGKPYDIKREGDKILEPSGTPTFFHDITYTYEDGQSFTYESQASFEPLSAERIQASPALSGVKRFYHGREDLLANLRDRSDLFEFRIDHTQGLSEDQIEGEPGYRDKYLFNKEASEHLAMFFEDYNADRARRGLPQLKPGISSTTTGSEHKSSSHTRYATAIDISRVYINGKAYGPGNPAFRDMRKYMEDHQEKYGVTWIYPEGTHDHIEFDGFIPK